MVVAYLSLSWSWREVGWGGRLFEAVRLLTFSAFRMGAYSRWALIRINTVFSTKVLNGDNIFTSPTGNGTAILCGHPSHAKV